MCRGAHAYSGKAQCAHNMAMALLEAREHLETHISTSRENWKYSNVHVNEYPSQPWSLTPFKALWHRETAVGGNTNTPCVSKYNMARIEDNKILKSTHTANYKQVIEFHPGFEPDLNLMSVDTGMGGNIFSGHYFTMNRRHLDGHLNNVSTDFASLLEQPGNYKLTL